MQIDPEEKKERANTIWRNLALALFFLLVLALFVWLLATRLPTLLRQPSRIVPASKRIIEEVLV